MNESPNNPTGGTGFTDTFSSQPASQANPFTQDLKGEFTSNFGTNTNAVSQIFKEGNFAGQSKKKYIVVGIGALVAVLAGAYLMGIFDGLLGDGIGGEDGDQIATSPSDGDMDGEPTDEATPAPAQTKATPAPVAVAPKVEPTQAPADSVPEDTVGKSKSTVGSAAVGQSSGHFGGKKASIGSGAIALSGPADAASLNYDETQGPAVFSWTGGGGYIVFSRNQSMHPPALKVPVYATSFEFHHPWPGKWYWKVENNRGAKQDRNFKVAPQAHRNKPISDHTTA
jgi:hypothetical protein